MQFWGKDPKMALLLTILAAVAVVGSAFDRNLRGDEAKGTAPTPVPKLLCH